MATLTPNLKLVLPDYSDQADIKVFNDNFRKIDEHYIEGGGEYNEDLQNAVNAANAWANATASAESVSSDSEADVTLTENNTSKNLHFKIPRGQSGVVISNTEPSDPDIKVWINPIGNPDEPVTNEELKKDVDKLKEDVASLNENMPKPWLKGTTSEITPAQVRAAITENDQSVMIYHEVDEYGMVGFSNFVVSVDGNGVAASVVFKMGGDEDVPVYYTLIGMLDSGTWTVAAGVIADAQTVAQELDSMDQAISRMEQKKADREYIVQVFEELKALILACDTGGAVALLDQAILDQAVLA